jgi:hypothetical protein
VNINEPSGSIKCGELLGYLSDYHGVSYLEMIRTCLNTPQYTNVRNVTTLWVLTVNWTEDTWRMDFTVTD